MEPSSINVCSWTNLTRLHWARTPSRSIWGKLANIALCSLLTAVAVTAERSLSDRPNKIDTGDAPFAAIFKVRPDLGDLRGYDEHPKSPRLTFKSENRLPRTLECQSVAIKTANSGEVNRLLIEHLVNMVADRATSVNLATVADGRAFDPLVDPNDRNTVDVPPKPPFPAATATIGTGDDLHY